MKLPVKAIPFKERRDANITKNDRILVTVKIKGGPSKANLGSIHNMFKEFYKPAKVEVAVIDINESIDISRVKICPDTGKIKKMDKLK